MKHVIIIFIILFAIFSCDVAYQNPIDPGADNYQGFPVVDDIDQLEALQEEYLMTYFLPKLQCSYIRGVEQYEFQLAVAGSNFADLVPAISPSASNVLELEDHRSLFDARSYDWRVRAYDQGVPGQWVSSPHAFYVMTIDGNYVTPVNGGVYSPGEVTFSFPFIPGVSTYEIQQAITEAGLASTQSHFFSNNYTHNNFNLLDGETRYWRVRPIHDDGRVGFWSEAFTVTGQDNTTPSFTIDIQPTQPLDTAQVDSPPVTITWYYDGNSEYANLVNRYEIRYAANDPNLADNLPVQVNTNGYTIQSNELNANDILYWQVRAILSDDRVSTWSNTFSFTMGPPASLEFNTYTPTYNASVQDTTVDLTWDPVGGSQAYSSYELRYSNVSETALSSVSTVPTANMSYVIPSGDIGYGDTVYWQVRGVKASDSSYTGWSAVNRFQSQWTVDWSNLVVYPAHSNPIQDIPDVVDHLEWDGIPGANRYEITIQYETTSRVLAVDFDGNHYFANFDDSNTGMVEETTVGTTYTWTIYAYDDDNILCPSSGTYQFQRRAPQLGEQLYGGYVIHVDGPNNRALVAAVITQEISDSIGWGSAVFHNNSIMPQSGLYQGGVNTAQIINQNPMEDNAAFRIANWVGPDGTDDWYLPTWNEIKEIQNLFNNGYTTIKTNLNLQDNQLYWSSVEEDPGMNANSAYAYNISDNYPYGNVKPTQLPYIPFRIQEY